MQIIGDEEPIISRGTFHTFLYDKGYSVRQAATILDVSHSALSRWLRYDGYISPQRARYLLAWVNGETPLPEPKKAQRPLPEHWRQEIQEMIVRQVGITLSSAVYRPKHEITPGEHAEAERIE